MSYLPNQTKYEWFNSYEHLTGNYLSISGKHNLIIGHEDPEDKMLGFEIVNFKNSERVSSAIAFLKMILP